MSWRVRVVVAGLLILLGALFVNGSNAVEWVTADKSVARIDDCKELVEYHDPGLWCYGKDGRGIAGADRGELGHRIQIVRVPQPPGAPGHPDATAYTWSDRQSLILAIGTVLLMVALIALAWPAVGALLRRRRTVSA